jgi:hypothetical protein
MGKRGWGLSLLAVLAAGGLSCGSDEGECGPGVRVAVTDGELTLAGNAVAGAVPCENGVCEGACCFDGGTCGPGGLVCDLGRVDGKLAAGKFRVDVSVRDGGVWNFIVAAKEPDLRFAFDVPMTFRNRDQESFSAEGVEPEFRFAPLNSCSTELPPATVTGTRRLVFRSISEGIREMEVAGSLGPTVPPGETCLGLPMISFSISVREEADEEVCR